MRAMILAAGLGTRLRPLTFVRPKVLVPVLGVPVLDFWIERLCAAGFKAVVVNAFHLPEALLRAVREGSWPIPVEVRVETDLLGTGGGIRNVLDFFQGEPLAVINGDVVSDVDLKALYGRHVESGAQVSLVMHDCPPFNNVAVTEEGAVLGFGREAVVVGESRPGVAIKAFTGIHFLNPDVVEALPAGERSSILSLYRELIECGTPPRALFPTELFWREMGSVEAYSRLNEELCGYPAEVLLPLPTGRRIIIHPNVPLSAVATDRFRGWVVIGSSCRIEEGVELENVILWNDVRVAAGSRLKNSIVADGATVQGDHENAVLVNVAS